MTFFESIFGASKPDNKSAGNGGTNAALTGKEPEIDRGFFGNIAHEFGESFRTVVSLPKDALGIIGKTTESLGQSLTLPLIMLAGVGGLLYIMMNSK